MLGSEQNRKTWNYATPECQCKMMLKKIHVCLLTSPAAVTPDKLIFVTNETFGGWSGYCLPHSNFKEYIRPSYGHCELNKKQIMEHRKDRNSYCAFQ